jgi:biopolymer transport protein ExbB/TolQ
VRIGYIILCVFIFTSSIYASRETEADRYLAEAQRNLAKAKRGNAKADIAHAEAKRSLEESQRYLAEATKRREQGESQLKKFMTFYATIAITAPILIIAGAKRYNLNPFSFLSKVFFKS